MAPGVNRLGRQTGTVPKTKTPNNSGQDGMAVSRTQSRSNIPNNLTSQDWQPVPSIGRNRQRKTSNTQAGHLDYYEGSDARSTNESSRRFSTENQDTCSSINRHIGEVNGLEGTVSPSTSRSDCVRRNPRNIMPDKENKSNITKMPDRGLIKNRLDQIRDYIQQTASVMERLKSTGEPSHLVQYHKLAGMLDGLRDSEEKLAVIMRSLDSSKEENSTEDHEEAAAVNSLATNGLPEVNGVHENGNESNGNEPENGAVLKTTDGSRCNELRLRLEESQKKLQAMQEHQAALQALQQRTQEQLKEARAAQSSLMARTAAAAAAAIAPDPDEEQGLETLQGNLESYRERDYAVHEIYEHRNQDKLQELQSKKQRMDHLVAEFQSLSNGAASLQSSREKASGASSKEESDEEGDGNLSDIECDVQNVRQKMAQLAAMKAQLKRLQNLVDSGLQDTDAFGLQELVSGQGDMSPRVDEVDEGEEEQAVNLRRQRQGKGRSVSRTNSTSSTTTKPDNISQATIGTLQESEMAIERKARKLKEAKSRLHQMQSLLATVMDLRSNGEPVPDHYLQLLEEETARVDQEQAVEAAEAEARAQDNREDREGARALVSCVNGFGPSQGGRESYSPEVTLEMMQAMAQEIRAQTLVLQEEKERLMHARQEIGNLRDMPLREKKTNTQMLLQAKRRELEELMRKDQGQSSAVNQDICSELSAGKSEIPGFGFIGEGTSAATWGGSTQGTLDDLGERDDDVHEQSAGYSSDEGQDEEESCQIKLSQLNMGNNSTNNNNNNNNSNSATSIKKECLAQTASTNRDSVGVGLEAAFGGGQCGSVNSGAASGAGPYPPAQSLSGMPQQRSGPRNVWRKSSTDSSATLPRAVWTPSQHPNTADELAANVNNSAGNSSANHNENESNINNVTQLNQVPTNVSMQNNWWQQQAMQLQSQLDATNRLYQSLLVEQQQQQQSMPLWPHPPAMLPQMPALRAPFPATTNDTFYQQLLSASQFQQQQLLLTTLNQCCHLMWMQQREMSNLRGIVMGLQERLSREGYPSAIAFSEQPEDSLLISSSQTSVHQTPHQSQSNLSRSNTNSTLGLGNQPCHPPLKLSHSGSLFQLPEDFVGAPGATSTSLPNLSHSPMPGPFFPDPTAASAQQQAAFLNNSLGSRFPNPQPLTHCSVPQAAAHAHGAPWLQQGGSSGTAPGLLSAHASSASPVPALNNQVPPGNRANNYWDNFRSYSRQNLLSTSTKSNEGISHSPSPLVDRSHNTLRNSGGLGPQPGPAQPPFALPEQGLPLNLSRKEKLNIERYHAVSDNYTLPSGTVPDVSELQYHSPLANNQYQHNANMQQADHHLSGARALPTSVSNNTSSGDARGPSTWHGRQSMRPYRTQRGANCKRKNPRMAVTVAGAPAMVDHPPSSSSLASTPQDRNTRKHREALCHRTGRSLFDVLSESVYTEVAALIAVNEARPHFLIQLFRDLQMVSSDPLRQRTLQAIHELVSRYLAEASGIRQASQVQQNTKTCKMKEPVRNSTPVSSDDEGTPKMVAAPPPSLSHPSILSPPRNAGWNASDDIALPSILPGQNEWELEAVLEDLLPFLRNHLDEMCSPSLLEAVRQQAVQLMLAQTQASRHSMPQAQSPQQLPAGGYFQGQLDALLEDGLNKFQGCRLRDVCEDLLVVITDILQSELTFLKLVDTVRREVDESSEDACKNPQVSEEPANSLHSLQLGLESATQSFPVEPPCQNRLESLGSAEGYNGDLAEADQSHHEEAVGGLSPQHADNEMAGNVVPEDSDDDGLLEIMQSDLPRGEEKQEGPIAVLSREDCEEQAKTEAEDEWAVEQDREQGLDRVPTRLTDEVDAQHQQTGPTANLPDTSNP